MAVLLILGSVFLLIVVCSLIGARRGTPMAFDPSDPTIVRAQAEAAAEAQRDHGAHFGGS